MSGIKKSINHYNDVKFPNNEQLLISVPMRMIYSVYKMLLNNLRGMKRSFEFKKKRSKNQKKKCCQSPKGVLLYIYLIFHSSVHSKRNEELVTVRKKIECRKNTSFFSFFFFFFVSLTGRK